MATRYDNLPVDENQIDDINLLKEEAEGLATTIDLINMDSRLKARAKSSLEDVVLYAVKGISRKQKA